MTALMRTAAALALLAVPMPATAAQVACEGFSPVETGCETTIVPDTDRIDVVVTTDATFVGLISVTLSDADDSVTLPCPQASLATSDCHGEAVGTFDAGTEVRVRVEVFSFEGVTPSVGNWLVIAQG